MIVFAAGLALVVCGGVAALALRRRPERADRWFARLVVAGCVVALVPAVAVLFAQPLPGGGGSEGTPFGIDALSAWFLLAVLGVGAVTAAYGTAYMARERPHRPVAFAHLLTALLIAGLAAVVTARTVVAFLAAWEVMALAAFLLVTFEHEKPQVRRAGFVYIVLTHTCTLALLGMFALWAGGNASASFTDLARASASGQMGPVLLLGLALVGFGIKAGVVPFHFWLPDAHSATPSHVSALMSGVVIKMGIYGLFRLLVLMGTPPAAWGWTLLVLGLASAILGVLWALAQHDLKRLLAYHSVENIGIILIGMGLGALGTAYHQPVVAALGYAGALMHTLNHALFKSLLFLGAGSVGHATGTREIDRLGGLLRALPRTAFAFLIGAVAIVGLPPLNGFVSEWLIFRGLLRSGLAADGLRLACVGVVGLALTGALALACFSKLYGVVFLGTPRDPLARVFEGESRGLARPQLVLAAACALIGLAPALVFPELLRALAVISPEAAAGAGAHEVGRGALAISGVAAALLIAGVLAWVGRRRALRGRATAQSETWGCGYPEPTARMQYTASSYAAPLLTAFGPISGSRVERLPDSFRTRPRDLVLDLMGRPLWRRISGTAADIRVIQSGGVRWYLLYTIACLLALLFYLRYMAAR